MGAAKILQKLFPEPGRLQLINAYLGDAKSVNKIFAENAFDDVIHFAAVAYVGESTLEPLRDYHNITSNTLVVFRGSGRTSCEDNNMPINPYGKAKKMSEDIIIDFFKTTNMAVMILSVIATIMALPSPSTAGRLLLLLKSISEVSETSSSKRSKKKSAYSIGSLVQAEVDKFEIFYELFSPDIIFLLLYYTEIKPLELRLKLGIGFRGRVHKTEVNDDKDNIPENPFSNFRVGQTVTARIVAKSNQPDNKKSHHWELSIKPTLVTGKIYLYSTNHAVSNIFIWFFVYDPHNSPKDEPGVLKAVQNVHAMIDKEVVLEQIQKNVFVCGFSQGGACFDVAQGIIPGLKFRGTDYKTAEWDLYKGTTLMLVLVCLLVPMQNLGKLGIYYVGTGKGRSVKEFVEACEKGYKG
ncbi:hypothetical protein Pint_36337 [Pistacia integerrima]|uniref:Uncharacterized protein n=1 Tax=Pistacia integerrima TaxID=434235 RepID=A0ACC0Y397_9ROSI|nr:hypothetical protein Pint_36337 [Pistacia integerrima]